MLLLTKTILIADDEPNHVSTLSSLLTERGYKVLSASNGEEAVLRALEYRPQLIILDIMMPKMDGTEAARLLKEDARTKDIPVFFVTAVISPTDQKMTSGNPNKIFAKPVKLNELLIAIQNVVADKPSF